MYDIITVSYTHLDVYKRQSKQCDSWSERYTKRFICCVAGDISDTKTDRVCTRFCLHKVLLNDIFVSVSIEFFEYLFVLRCV